MKKTNRNTLLAVCALIIVIASMFAIWKQFSPGTSEGDKTIAVTVTHTNGGVKDFEINTDAEFLWDAMAERDLIDGTDSQYGKWITTVDGETADEASGQYWMFTKSGEWVTTSCDTTPIADGEAYEFFIYEYE